MAKKKGPDGGVADILSSLQSDLNKHFGDNSAALLGAPGTLSKIDHWVSSRSIVVDSVLRGGRPPGSSLIPFSRMIEISGPNNSGKTTLCAQAAAETQAQGGIVVVTDTEERIDEVYWTKLGVDINRILRVTATDLKDVFNKQYKALQFARDHAPDRLILMIWDSLGGTAGASMMDADSKEDAMTQAEKFAMRRAAVIGAGIELVNTIVSKTRACYMYTNHEYLDFNVKYGSKIKTRGGDKPKYFATVRLRLSSCGEIKVSDGAGTNEKVIGQKIRVKALKNSMSGLRLERDAVIMVGQGFVNEYTVFEAGAKLGVISKSGSWSTWLSPSGEEIKFQGYNGFTEKVVTHPEYQTLVDQVVDCM